jgi:hypothetical protein
MMFIQKSGAKLQKTNEIALYFLRKNKIYVI